MSRNFLDIRTTHKYAKNVDENLKLLILFYDGIKLTVGVQLHNLYFLCNLHPIKNKLDWTKVTIRQSMFEELKQIAEAQEATMRLCRILVAGFRATGEKDIDYMDSFMDELWECFRH